MPEPLRFLTIQGRLHLVIFGILIPFLSIRSYYLIRKAPQKLPDRRKHFRVTAIQLVLFAALSILTAWLQRVDLFHVDGPGLLRALPAAAAMYGTTVLLMRPRWRKAVLEKKPLVRLFMPSTPGERAWWITVAL